VDDAAGVGGGHRPGQQFGGQRRLAGRLGLAGDLLGEAAAGQVLQGEVRQAIVLADLEDLDDVRVLQSRDGLRLGVEAGQLVRPGVGAGQHHLEGDDAV
jgi:hypothetical protein